MIFLFILFCSTRLFRGHYNQLIGFITFESKHHSPPKVVKFALAFTTICNFSKGAGSIFMAEQCGYLSFGGYIISFLGDDWKENMNARLAVDMLEIVSIYAFAISFIAIFFWLNIWGFCLICKRRDTFFTGVFSFWVVSHDIHIFFREQCFEEHAALLRDASLFSFCIHLCADFYHFALLTLPPCLLDPDHTSCGNHLVLFSWNLTIRSRDQFRVSLS